MKILVISEPSPMRAPVLDLLSRRSHTLRLLASDADEWSRAWPGRLEPRSCVDIDDAVTLAAYGCDAAMQLTMPTRRAEQGHELRIDLERLRRIVEAIARGQVRRFVSLSAGRAAEGVIRGFADEWMIVCPALVYGPDDPVVWPLMGLLRGMPAPRGIPDGGRRTQPLFYQDLAGILAQSVELASNAMRQTVRVAGPLTITLQELVDAIAEQVQHSPPRLPGSNLDTDVVRQILHTVDDHPHDPTAVANVTRLFGITPTSLSDGLQRLLDEHTARLRIDRTAS